MANHPNEQQEALRQAIHQTQDLIDSIYAHSIGITRLVGLEPIDVPRLCVSAGCRTVELLIEKHSRRLELHKTNPEQFPYPAPDQLVMRNTIVAASADLVACLEEATTAAKKIAEFTSQLDPAKTQGLQ